MTGKGFLVLEEIQRALESFYRLDPAPSVLGFLVDEPSRGREQLLVLEDQDLFLGVALDRKLPLAVEKGPLEAGNLQEFCLLVEGVSHYLCVIFCARQERAVSVKELELQAEVDKYVACALLAVRAPELTLDRLHGLLFDGFDLLPELDPAERLRYVVANHLARRYTRALHRVLARRLGWAAVLTELRRFYRLAYAGKQQLIDRR